MPEMIFRVIWPGGEVENCYSPSTIIAEHFAPATDYRAAEFLARARSGLNAASDRVRAKFGMGCGQAMAQLASIEARGAALDPQSTIRVDTIREI